MAAVRPIFLPVLRICLSHSYCFGTLVLSRNGCQAFRGTELRMDAWPRKYAHGAGNLEIDHFLSAPCQFQTPGEAIQTKCRGDKSGVRRRRFNLSKWCSPPRGGDEMQLVRFFFPFRCLNGFRFGQPKPLICRTSGLGHEIPA